AGAAWPLGVFVLAGLCLAGSIAFNPFVGALFAIVWGLSVMFEAVRTAKPVTALSRAAIAAVPAAAALAWCLANQMTGNAQGMLKIGLLGNARNAPLLNLLLSLGPALVPAVIGVILAAQARRARALVAPSLLLVTSLCVMHLLVLAGDDSWVGFRAGQMILAGAPGLIAAGLAATGGRKIVATSVVALAMCVGLPTTAIDVYNAQDITNLSEGPGFPWTQVLDRHH